MKFSQFLMQRRTLLNLSTTDIADRLSANGYSASRAAVSHWENERNGPPISDSKFRRALALALDLDVNSMLTQLGYITLEETRSANALLGAELIDQMTQRDQELAINILKQILEHYKESTTP